MTDAIKIALITGSAPTIATLWNIYKSNQIHTLVNSKMTAALKRIEELESLLKAKDGTGKP
jgi:hypothetical protein